MLEMALALWIQDPVNISNSPLSSEHPQIVSTPAGMVAAWVERDEEAEPPKYTVVTAALKEGRWGRPEAVHSGTGAVRNFHLLEGALAWTVFLEEDKPHTLMVATGRPWKVERHLEDQIRWSGPLERTLGLAGEGALLHVAFLKDGESPAVHYAAIGKGAPLAVSKAEAGRCRAPAVAVSEGRVHIAWVQGKPGSFALHTSAGDGKSFSEPAQAELTESIAYLPRLAAGGKLVWALWGEKASDMPTMRPSFFLAPLADGARGEAVENPHYLRTDWGCNQTLNGIADDKGNLHVAGFKVDQSEGFMITVEHGVWDSSGWKSPWKGELKRDRALGRSFIEPWLAVDSEGVGHLVFSEAVIAEGKTRREVYYLKMK
jgi:hypothetical protein